MQKQIIFVFMLQLFVPLWGKAQCSKYFFMPEKWTVNAETNFGTTLSADFGNGPEIGYGFSMDWAPFKRLIYPTVGIKRVQQFLTDNSPNPNFYATDVLQVSSKTNYLRTALGLKLRLDWFFKAIEYEGIHYYIGTYYLFDAKQKHATELTYADKTETTNTSATPDYLSGRMYDTGISWVFNERFKWDVGAYLLYLEDQPKWFRANTLFVRDSKIGFGVTTGIFYKLAL